ncbi:uncharacterized protein LOC143257450 [Tachypleus tridentatus]|uniref:uncharacterized protein LOC143257450 n=1 Tax=Tachypleus tridentatus TaxID=6853 RepID=UPI003FD647D7
MNNIDIRGPENKNAEVECDGRQLIIEKDDSEAEPPPLPPRTTKPLTDVSNQRLIPEDRRVFTDTPKTVYSDSPPSGFVDKKWSDINAIGEDISINNKESSLLLENNSKVLYHLGFPRISR